MALERVVNLHLRTSEINDIRTCPDVELGEQCEDECYLGQGHTGSFNKPL